MLKSLIMYKSCSGVGLTDLRMELVTYLLINNLEKVVD